MSFILASASLRRAELLNAAGFLFEIVPAEVEETTLTGEQRSSADRIILAADTVVVAGERLMGKPVDAKDAESMLNALSGAAHQVHTAVVVRSPAGQAEEVVTTKVRFTRLSDAEIAWYLSTGEFEGKAGGYGIQGRAARFIDGIDGSWSNVVGWPIATVYRLLSRAGGLGQAANRELSRPIDRIER